MWYNNNQHHKVKKQIVVINENNFKWEFISLENTIIIYLLFSFKVLNSIAGICV